MQQAFVRSGSGPDRLKKAMPPTIYDVAKRAGVSITSVSLVMKDHTTNRVGKKRKEKILQIAQEMGYRPSNIARALSEGSTKILGVFIPLRQTVFSSHFVTEILAGLQSVASQHNYDLMIYSHNTTNGRVTAEELNRCKYADGIAVLNTRLSSQQDIEATIHDLNGIGRPFVMMNGYYGTQNINYVGIDDMLAGKVATEYLVAKGRKHFAVLSGSRRCPISSYYLSGVRAGLAGTSIKIPKDLIAYSEYDVDVADAIAARWFECPTVPDAILAIDDQVVPPLYRAVRKRGLVVGKDVAIISRGSAAFARSLEPNLTTTEIAGQEIGEKAAHMLLQSLRDNHVPPKRILLSSPLLLNASA